MPEKYSCALCLSPTFGERFLPLEQESPSSAVTWGGVGAVVFSGAKQTWIQSQCLLAGTVGKVISTPLSPISLTQVEPSCNIEGHSEDEDL